MKVYLDNAASTPLDPEVFEAMLPYFQKYFGNPSSIHSHGRETRSAIEKSRRKVAELLNCSPAEIFFTSGGTEADNTAIINGIKNSGITHAITSKIEHHAVLHPLEFLEKEKIIRLSYVDVNDKGILDLKHLEDILHKEGKSFVSLMHGNNELGNIADIETIGEICSQFGSVFHSDTVQTVSHIPINLQNINVDYITGSAHKFHGPKGTGFLYNNSRNPITPFIHGGSQERNVRGGTENVAGIVGLAKALELAHNRMEDDKKYIQGLKDMLKNKLIEKVPGIEFNGDSANEKGSLFTILSASLPENEDNEMLLFNLDIAGISVSGGSACTSGSIIGSHVLQTLNVNQARGHLRFSFSRLNTIDEIAYTVHKIEEIFFNSTNSKK